MDFLLISRKGNILDISENIYNHTFKKVINDNIGIN